jgi:hypothetical protein
VKESGMSNWNECERCNSLNGGYAKGIRCLEHQTIIDKAYSGLIPHFVEGRPKSDMEVIIEKLGKIESRLSKLEKGE